MRSRVLLVVSIALACALSPAQELTIPEVADADKICFALYTVHEGVLKLTAQLYPLDADDPRTARLEIDAGDGWKQVAETPIIEPGWTAPFRVAPWDASRIARYRVLHGDAATYTGTIQRDPVDKAEIVVAAFTGNSILAPHGGDIDKSDIVRNLELIKPDLLFFSGDQIYDHTRHLAAWLKFGRDFGEAIRSTPTITIPDDHDVGQSNLWGAGGKVSKFGAGHDGGFRRSVEYVNEVQRAQTSHLPDPYDATPIDRGITVYYTALTWGRISFAILEDRKWKTGPDGFVPAGLGPRPDHVTTSDFDPSIVDLPGAQLLGERQLAFLRDWAQDWDNAEMKAVLSQTIFANAANLHGQPENRLVADLDSNGWPQSGRNAALREIRKAFAPMIAGDQHLGSVIHHGIDDWNDAGYSFCVPSIANLYLRWWSPPQPGKNRPDGAPEYIGENLDGLGNKITIAAVANPELRPNDRDKLTTRAAGFGVVRFNRNARTITFECWPRNVDLRAPDAKQYPGWPITIRQEDNHGKPVASLPTLRIREAVDPVVQVIDESNGEVVYTLRIQGGLFRPVVFREGSYTVRLIDGDSEHRLTGIQSLPLDAQQSIAVDF